MRHEAARGRGRATEKREEMKLDGRQVEGGATGGEEAGRRGGRAAASVIRQDVNEKVRWRLGVAAYGGCVCVGGEGADESERALILHLDSGRKRQRLACRPGGVRFIIAPPSL